MKGRDIETRVRLVLDDPSKTGWSDDELAAWINDACLFVAVLRPDSCVVNANMTLVEGTRQSIAALTPPGLRLLDVVYNVSTKRAMRLVDRRRLDSTMPTWHNLAPGTPTDYTFDNRDPTTFYVYPPSQAGQQLNIVYGRVPVKIAAADFDSVELSPADVFLDSIVNYVLFRSKSKEAEHAADVSAAAGYRALSAEILGVKGNIDRMLSPVQNTPGATPTPGGM